MKAVYYLGNCRMELREIPVPTPKEDEYLIHIDACGICGSDVEGFLGRTGRRIPPMIMGHECSGTVVKAPAGGKIPEGTAVAIFPKFFCGKCENCRAGRVNICSESVLLGVMDFDGAMTEYICAKEQYLIPYTGIGAEIASLAEPAAVAYNGVYKISNGTLAQAENILLVGCGTIGAMVLAWLKYRGAKHVIVSDMSDARLEIAKKLGADDVINPAVCGDFEEAVSGLTAGKLCDISIEAVGVSPTAASSVQALKAGGTAVWIGNAAKMVSVDMQKIVTKELEIKGNYIYTMEGFVKSVQLLASGEINVQPIISRVMDMEEAPHAFDLLTNNRDGKLVKIILTNK